MKEDLLRRCLSIVYPICSNFYLQFNLFIIEIRKDFLQIRIDKFKTPVKNSFQIILIGILCVFSSFSLFAQDKFYTKGLVNGYAWVASPSESMLAYTKGESFSRMLNRRKYQTQIQREVSFPLGCELEIEDLLKSNSSSDIDLQTIETMIDKFYEKKENLVIPVLGAYCCCIKELAGASEEDIEKYRKKLLDYSNMK
jgi:hypothetical protein